jgi:hypothetical protein
MAEDRPSSPTPGGNKQRRSTKDIASILTGWDYEAGAINVRKIVGQDGQPKLQMRLDLGLLQMELTGRPDGNRPHNCESLLEYHERRLRSHRKKTGSESGFRLTSSQCQSLREEAHMYYQRYLSLFVLGDLPGVARDTARNLRVLDLCGKYAANDQDKLVLEQYRPYITMMNTRAMAQIEHESGNLMQALSIVRRGLRDMKRFFARFNQEDAYKHSNEAKVLRRLRRDLKGQLPVDPVKKLEKELTIAVKEERYEEAAKLRDQMEKLRTQL